MNKFILILAVLLSGCGLIKDGETNTLFKTEKIICDDQLQINSLEVLPVEFVSSVDIKSRQVLGLDGENYTNLSLNTRATLEYIRSQKAYIRYLKGCMER